MWRPSFSNHNAMTPHLSTSSFHRILIFKTHRDYWRHIAGGDHVGVGLPNLNLGQHSSEAFIMGNIVFIDTS